MPTYNRRDTITRAIDSIRRQTFVDWELIVVDDGSSDGTADVIAGVDERIRLVSQENQGCYVARNTGLRMARGRWLSFMDSDDEWLPHFLELTVGFLESSPGDHMVMTEFFEDFGRGPEVRHDLQDIATQFARMATRVGSHLVDLPAGESDDYLRVYSTREDLGEWGKALAARVGHPRAALYRGHLFEYLRFGHLGWLPILVLSREALATVGEFLPSYRTAADYRFLGLLFKNYRASMISIPSAIKHNMAADGRDLAEGHLASGAHEYRFAVHRLPLYDEFFRVGREHDEELRRIRGLYLWYAGRVAARLGKRREAVEHLAGACEALPSLLPARALHALMIALPSDATAGAVYRAYLEWQVALRLVAAGKLSVSDLVRKVGRRVVGGGKNVIHARTPKA